MARPRVFISSTFYDLRHIRAALDGFISSLGFEPILSEKGGVTYEPDIPLDQSCYREVSSADVYVLIVGGRYGSASSTEKHAVRTDEIEKYNSVTKQEFRNAYDANIPIYILVEKGVYAEYQTYKLNRDRVGVQYAHVDSVDVFIFIEEILSKSNNNPTHSFDSFADIEYWLREQWAGLFRELLVHRNQARQISSFQAEINKLGVVTNTLKTYLEEVVEQVSPDKSKMLIGSETKRIKDAEIDLKIRNNRYFKFVFDDAGNDDPQELKTFKEVVGATSTVEDFIERMLRGFDGDQEQIQEKRAKLSVAIHSDPALRDLNEIRELVGKPAFLPSKKRKIFDRVKNKRPRPE